MKRYLLFISIIIFLFLLSYEVQAQSNQTVANGALTNAVTFPGTGCTYNWVNDMPGIGLAASGTGNIASFTAVNLGNNPITATITTTPTPVIYAYIANYGSDNVSVINTGTNLQVATIAVGTAPWSVALSPDGSRVYVTNYRSGDVSVINTATNSVVATINTGFNPIGAVVSPDGTRVYVTNLNSGTVSVINTLTNTVVATVVAGIGPTGVVISPDGSKVYVSNSISNTVSVINTANNTVVSTITVSGVGPTGLAITPDGTQLYLADNTSNTVSVINTVNNTATATINVGQNPACIAISPDGTKAYVTNLNGTSISVIDTSTNLVIATIPAGVGSYGVSVSPDGSQLYVTNNANNVADIDIATNSVKASITVGQHPSALGNFIASGTNCGPVTVKFTITVNPLPALIPAITAGAATGIVSACAGTASANPNIQQFTASGNNLLGNILIRAPAGFEVSLASGTGYGSIVTLIQTGGMVNNTVVYIRSASGAPPGNISGNVTLTSKGTSKAVAVTGTINALPAISSVSNQVFTNGNLASGVTFSATSGATVNWVNNSPAIGLAASGTGDISPFSVVNTLTSPVVATFTATPVSATGCTGLPAKFSITVNPSPTIMAGNVIGSISACTGAPSASPFIEQFAVSGINLTGNIIATAPTGFEISLSPGSGFGGSVSIKPTGGVINNIPVYVRSAIAAAMGNISGKITLTSTGASSQQVTVAGIIVALPTVNQVGNQTVLNGAPTTTINFTGTGNAVYYWTGSVTFNGIGLGTGQIGSILSFIGRNPGTTPVTDVITVIPMPVGYAYIANYASNTVSVINISTNVLLTTINVGSGPISVSVSPDGSRVYVANETSNDISVINTATNSVMSVIPVGSSPYAIVTSPDASLLYVANYYSNSVSVINAASNAVIATIPVGNTPDGICVSPDGTRVYVTNYYSDDVSVINTATNTVVTTISVGSLPNGMAISPNGVELYVTNQNSNDVSVINTVINKVTATVPVGTTPSGIAVSPNGFEIYVANTGSNDVSIIVTGINLVRNTIAVGSGPDGVAISPDGFQLYVTNSNSNTVSVVDPVIPFVTSTVKVGSVPLSQGNFITIGKGCNGPPMMFSITVNPTLSPTVVATGTIAPLTTTYGTASAAGTFIVSGSNLTAGVLVTPPSGFEVSTDNINFSGTVTITAVGSIPPTAVYIRLLSTTAAGGYSGNIIVTSPGAISQQVVVSGTVNPAALTITANNVNKVYGTTLTGTTGSSAFTATGLQNNETIGNIYITYGAGSAATDAAGRYAGSVTPSSPSGGSFTASNYTITFLPGDIIVTASPLIITADNQNKTVGQVNPVLTASYSGFLNNDGPAQLTKRPVITTTAVKASPAGQYPITASGAASSDYTFIYVPGVLTINAVISFVIPNTFTPNGDGVNDTWNIKNLATYPNCTVQVFNRYGENVYSSIGYGVAWDGTYKGAALPVSTYYYIIDLKNGSGLLSGFVAIIR